jgi:hypothetical protein
MEKIDIRVKPSLKPRRPSKTFRVGSEILEMDTPNVSNLFLGGKTRIQLGRLAGTTSRTL